MFAQPLRSSSPDLYHGKYAASLFASGEQGAWYDPSDLTTMFQDAAGTTPVTGVEQPVGIILDKSKGLVLGSERVSNGDFGAGATGWAAIGSATLTVSAGIASVNVTGASGGIVSSKQSLGLTVGVGYQVSFDVDLSAMSAGGLEFRVAGIGVASITTSGSKKAFFVASVANPTISIQRALSAAGTFTVDNISVREIPGNHATQTTTASRPVLSARVNLLTKTEDFSGWQISRSSVTTSDVLSPDKINYAKVIVNNIDVASGYPPYILFNGSGMSPLNTYKTSCCMKKGLAKYGHLRIDSTGGTATGVSAYFDLEAGTFAGYLAITNATPISATIIDIGDGWYECTATFALGAGGAGLRSWVGMSNVYGDYQAAVGTLSIYIWGASLVPANQAHLPYQRVNTATDYDTQGFPLYLRFDGVDDSLVTQSINFTATDKMTVFTADHSEWNNSLMVLAGLSASVLGNNGTFWLTAYDWGYNAYSIAYLRGNLRGAAPYGKDQRTLGVRRLIRSVMMDIGKSNLSEEVLVRVNGEAQALGGAPLDPSAGTGNFGNYPLYIGRVGTTAPFNGRLYGLIVRGAQTDSLHLTNVERFLAHKSGVVL